MVSQNGREALPARQHEVCWNIRARGAITGALAGYQEATSSKYERNTIFGHKTEAGNKAQLKDLIDNFVRSKHISADMNTEIQYVSRQTEASGETTLGRQRYRGGKIYVDDTPGTAQTVPVKVTQLQDGSFSSESRIYMTRSSLRTYRKAYDILGHEVVHARLNKSGLYWQWSGELPTAVADRLGEILAYRWQIQEGMRLKVSSRQYQRWTSSKYGY